MNQDVLAIAEYPGGAAAVSVPLRTIISDALRHGSAGLLLSHNHPSGDPTPSRADRAVTEQLVRVAEMLGIRVHDHLIYGDENFVSFRAMGLL